MDPSPATQPATSGTSYQLSTSGFSGTTGTSEPSSQASAGSNLLESVIMIEPDSDGEYESGDEETELAVSPHPLVTTLHAEIMFCRRNG